jgi:hypothetical protein
MTTYAGRPVFPPYFVDPSGNPQEAVTATIYLRGTTTKATVYTDRTKVAGSAAAPHNPVTADALGNADFYVDPGEYDALVNGVTLPFSTLPDPAEPGAEVTEEAVLAAIPPGTYVPVPTAVAPAIVATAGPLIPSATGQSAALKESIRLPYTSTITSTNKNGKVVNLIGVGLFPDGTMPYADGWLTLGDESLDYIHCMAPLDLAGQPIIDFNFVGNSEGLYNPRLSQALDSTVPQYNTLTVGISTMPVGGVGYLAAIDRLVFNSGQSVANSKATFKNLGSVELLSDSMLLKFGAAADVSLGAFGGGIRVQGAGGLLCNIFQDTATTGTYFEFAAGKLLVQPRGADPMMEMAVPARLMASVAGKAGLRVPHGTAPSSPVDGDVWTTTAGLFVRINGATVGPLS